MVRRSKVMVPGVVVSPSSITPNWLLFDMVTSSKLMDTALPFTIDSICNPPPWLRLHSTPLSSMSSYAPCSQTPDCGAVPLVSMKELLVILTEWLLMIEIPCRALYWLSTPSIRTSRQPVMKMPSPPEPKKVRPRMVMLLEV